MKQCVSQCSLGRVPHDCRYTTRIRQGSVYIIISSVYISSSSIYIFEAPCALAIGQDLARALEPEHWSQEKVC
jgi:hypothetical protein